RRASNPARALATAPGLQRPFGRTEAPEPSIGQLLQTVAGDQDDRVGGHQTGESVLERAVIAAGRPRRLRTGEPGAVGRRGVGGRGGGGGGGHGGGAPGGSRNR